MTGKHAVLVTGSSSGIGRETALLLAARGFQVFAGVRTDEAAARLTKDARGSLTTVRIDVKDEATIQSAEHVISSSLDDGASFSLVNNAGITVAGPLELLTTAALRDQFDVNVLGPIAVTRVFLPLLRGHRGRIVIMGSLFGRLALPFVAPYAAAKFALEAVADSLALELRDWKIPVTLLEPGNIATPIWEKSKSRVLDEFSSVPRDLYDLYSDNLEAFGRLTSSYARTGIPPLRVARTVARALSVRRPRSRYRVGWDSKVYGCIGPRLPSRLRYWILWRVVHRR
jgi:NAD(P)-dependent dehydrogenase (short-subunit alcohol dehydrogenase family)